MYVCVCQAVTERQIQQAVHNGARTLKELRRDLGVTLDCGRCASCAHDCLKEAQAGRCQTMPQSALLAMAT